MIEKVIDGRRNSYKGHLRFPHVVYKRDVISYKFDAIPDRRAKYKFVLYEFNKDGVPVQRHKREGHWSKGQTFAIDLNKDYYLRDGVEYALEVIIFNINNEELYDVVYIKP